MASEPSSPPHLMHFLKERFRPHQGWFWAFVACGCLSGTYGTFLWYVTKIIVDRLQSLTESNNPWPLLAVPTILFCLNYFVHGLSWRGLSFTTTKMIPRVVASIIDDGFAYVHRQRYAFFLEHPSGTLAHNIMALAAQIETVFTMILPHLVRGAMQMTLALTSVFFVHPIFSAIMAVWIIAFGIASYFLTQRTRQLATLSSEGMAKIAGDVVDSLANAPVVQIFAQQTHERERLQPFLEVWQTRSKKTRQFQNRVNFIFMVILFFFISAVIISLIVLKSRNVLTLGDFSFILGLSLFVSENITWVTAQIDHLQDAIGKIRQNLNAIYQPLPPARPSTTRLSSPCQGIITFRNVEFAYPQRSNLFKALSVQIPAGQHVGLVGYSGSGKTTFVHLLLRLFECANSTEETGIFIDHHNICDLSHDDLRRMIAFVPQDSQMFHRTLMDNIRFGTPTATDEDVHRSAQKAQLSDIIQALPEGYQTLVGERGIRLSGGQRQRVAIARALMKNAPIVILDEATSQLDSLTEQKIQAGLEELTHNRTCLIIAHRLSTLVKMDRILVFHQGQIVEDGSHTELLAMNGHYAQLWHAQLDGFMPQAPQNAYPPTQEDHELPLSEDL